MRTRRNLVTGIAAAALALTACGIAAGTSGGTPAGHAAVSGGQAPAGTWVTDQGDIVAGQAAHRVDGRESRADAAAAGGPGLGHGPAGPRPGQAGRRAARRAADRGQVSARAVPVAARAAGTRLWRVPGPGRPAARFTASACSALFGEAGEQGAGPPGERHYPPVLVYLQRPAQVGFGLVQRPRQLRHFRPRHQELGQP